VGRRRSHTSGMQFPRPICAAGLALLLSAAGSARVRADEVQLQGGSVIEGRATRDGDSVVIRVESGEIRLSADTVEHIKKSDASDDVAQRRRAALAPRDIRGRLELAAYCREHELRATERAVLEEVIGLEPNHAEARRLLGYVRTEQGWVDRSAQLQHAREAEHEEWLARARAREREQARTDLEREHDLAARQMASDADRMRNVRLRDENLRARDEVYSSPYRLGYVYAPAPAFSRRNEPYRPPPAPAAERCLPGGCAAAPSQPQPVSPIAGVRDPRDTTWALPGVKNPREWTR